MPSAAEEVQAGGGGDLICAAVDEVVAGVGGAGEEVVALCELAGRVQAALVERVARFDAA